MTITPAAIRYKNPGAMWPGDRATKWGSTNYVTLNDGQGNKIAVFPTFVDGAAAQFDLWASNYAGMQLDAAIKKWSGNNSPTQYVAYLSKQTGIPTTAKVTKALLASDQGWKLLKAQSRWEAGQEMPMTDAEWKLAQAKVFKGATAAQNVAAPTATYSKDVELVQQDLLTLGYKEIGENDGLIGSKTRGAITAFMTDRHMPMGAPSITPALKVEIAAAITEKWRRPIATDRAYATIEDIAPKVASVKPVQRAGWLAKVGTYLSTFGLATNTAIKFMPDAHDQAGPYISMAKEYMGTIPPWAPVVIMLGFLVFIMRSTGKAAQATVEDYQTGKIN